MKRLLPANLYPVRGELVEDLVRGSTNSPRTVLYGFDSLNNVPWDITSSRSRKPPSPTPTNRYRVPSGCSTLAHNDNAMSVSVSRESGGVSGVWLRVRMRKWEVLSFSTTVRPTRSVLREASQVL